MKKSSLLLGAAAAILAIAGALTTKASKVNHRKIVGTKSSGSCVSYNLTNGLTAVKITGKTFLTNSRTAFTSTNCGVTLFKITD